MAEQPLGITTQGDTEVTYSFVVNGSVAAADLGNGVSSIATDPTDPGGIERNVTIEKHPDGRVTVTGTTGGSFGDGYYIDGVLETFTANAEQSMYTVTLGGEVLDLSTLPVSTDPPEEPTCSGDISEAQEWAQGKACGQTTATMACPHGDTEYTTANTCETSYLQSLGWEVLQTHEPPDDGNGDTGNGGGNGDGNGDTDPPDGGNGGTDQPDDGILAGVGLGTAALVVGAGYAIGKTRKK